ncbi:MAG: DUF202 domain-containing protein [Candidatus Doudnabacteria bacterium]|nr:DUF202 domain-containing protein [Candidatus Doudnabacteria bacterium]
MGESELEKLRSHYANERTLLSYIRTSASLFVLAVALLKFFYDATFKVFGWSCLILGGIILFFGVYRYFKEREVLRRR